MHTQKRAHKNTHKQTRTQKRARAHTRTHTRTFSSVRKCDGMNDEGLKAGKGRRLSRSQSIQITAAAYPASHSSCREGSFPRVKLVQI